MECKKCGKKLTEWAMFCDSCGEWVDDAKSVKPEEVMVEEKKEEKLFCAQCGKELKKGSAFCGGCGWKVSGKAAEAVVKEEKKMPEVKAPVSMKPEEKKAEDNKKKTKEAKVKVEKKPKEKKEKKTPEVKKEVLVETEEEKSGKALVIWTIFIAFIVTAAMCAGIMFTFLYAAENNVSETESETENVKDEETEKEE